ncbi:MULTISPECIES: methionine/alanine import NSS transporter subunit MetS [Corynebacterium]|uniref:methionine/alanine import NSS transporter subunit MetS n=1 Tax=Corynebacterium TaxID=1716 RepID=UPI0008AA5D10|nr:MULTISPECIES: methionine/alanine import NSS transporter subunit MetS [Corynebacterium]MBC6761240.1 putative methionine/alanine importer small subunit [Corynebacterium sp. LK27]MDK7110569.1 methionine/alanine import NSS transporter subunit MetS [Corynebacterium amycolatum]MDK7145580.1 methionine/alanine import NSS transporter subunit MetS [Corynebacterium amycolatum]
MSGIAIVMMALFVIVIWGGLAVALISLSKHPDEVSGELGDHPELTSEVLGAQEEQ